MQNLNSDSVIQKHLSIGEASKYLGISIDTLRRWEKRGRVIPFRSPGGHRYYIIEELDKLFNKKYVRDEPTKKSQMVSPPIENPQNLNLPEIKEEITNVNPIPEKSPESIATQEQVIQEANIQNQPEIIQPQQPPYQNPPNSNPIPNPIIPETQTSNLNSILNPVIETSISQIQEEKIQNILGYQKNPRTNTSQIILITGVTLFTIIDVILFILWYSSTKIIVPVP